MKWRESVCESGLILTDGAKTSVILWWIRVSCMTHTHSFVGRREISKHLVKALWINSTNRSKVKKGKNTQEYWKPGLVSGSGPCPGARLAWDGRIAVWETGKSPTITAPVFSELTHSTPDHLSHRSVCYNNAQSTQLFFSNIHSYSLFCNKSLLSMYKMNTTFCYNSQIIICGYLIFYW